MRCGGRIVDDWNEIIDALAQSRFVLLSGLSRPVTAIIPFVSGRPFTFGRVKFVHIVVVVIVVEVLCRAS